MDTVCEVFSDPINFTLHLLVVLGTPPKDISIPLYNYEKTKVWTADPILMHKP